MNESKLANCLLYLILAIKKINFSESFIHARMLRNIFSEPGSLYLLPCIQYGNFFYVTLACECNIKMTKAKGLKIYN